MLSHAAGPRADLEEEGRRCKTSLQAFTEDLIGRLGLSPGAAAMLRARDHAIKDDNMYLHFPFCFREAFPGVRVEDLSRLALSGILWMSYMRAQDDVLDKRAGVDPTLLVVRDLYWRESLRLLARIFIPDSAFWNYYARYGDDYAKAVLHETERHTSVDSAYGETEFWSLAQGKAAMAKYPVAAMAVLSGDYRTLSDLERSLDCFHIGYQYWDDLVDWKEDLANSQYSFLLARAFERMLPEERRGADEKVREGIGRIIYYSGLADEHLACAKDWLERAYECSQRAGCPVWAGYVKRHQRQTKALANDLHKIISKRHPGVSLERP